MRACGVLSREDEYTLDGAEMTGQDCIHDDDDKDDYDDSFVPEGGFPVEPVARMAAPASASDASGPRSSPAELANESSLVY